MRNSLLLLLLVTFLFGCKGTDKNKLDVDYTYIPSDKITTIEKIGFDDNRFIDSCTFVTLESSEEAIFGKIYQIGIHDDKYYILDHATNRVKVFDSTGKFLSNIGTPGEGVGEYHSICSFVINEKENKICMFDPMPSSVHEYSLDGHFLKKVKYSDERFSCMEDAIWKDGYIYCFLDQSHFNSMMYYKISDRDYSVIDQWGEYPVKPEPGIQAGYSIGKHPISCYGDNVSCISLYSDTLYSYKEGELSPFLLIETGKPNIPSDYFKGKSFEFEPQDAYFHMLFVEDYSPGFSSLYETDRYILTYFFLKWDYYLIDKQTNEAFHVKNSKFPNFGNIDYVCGNRLVEIFTQEEIDSYKERIESGEFQCPECLKDIMERYDSDNDNPILVVYHMKK